MVASEGAVADSFAGRLADGGPDTGLSSSVAIAASSGESGGGAGLFLDDFLGSNDLTDLGYRDFESNLD